MTCSNCGQENPGVPQENPSSGPAITPGPVITPLHESGESFSDTTQSAGTSGGCKVSDYRFSRPTNVAIGIISTVAAGIFTLGILFIFFIGTRITNSSDIAIILYILGSSFLGLIIFSFVKGINDFICTKIFNFDLTRSVSFNLSGDNISVNTPWDGRRYSLSVNGLSRQIKPEDAQPFLSQLSMVDPIAYNRLNGMKNIVFDVNGRICRLFWFWVDEKNNYLFIDGIKVVDSGVQVVYELPAKNS